MKTTTTNELPCSVFGHNLELFTSISKHSDVLICKICQSKVLIDAKDEAERLPIKNEAITIAIRQLFLLKSQHSRRQLSM